MLLFYLIILSSPASAFLFEIDFNDLTPDVDVLTDQYAESNVIFSLLDTPEGYAAGPVATTLSTNPSLRTTISPGDDKRDPFYDINISFSKPIDFFSLTAFDADEAVTAKGYYNGSLVQSKSYGPGTNEQMYDMILGSIGGSLLLDTVIIDVVSGLGPDGFDGGPEWFDNLAYNTTTAPAPAPIPPAVLLLGTGIIGIAGLGRKKFRQK